MTAIAFAFAAVCFLLWVIEHFGGADARDRLRKQRDVARSMVHPSRRHQRSVD